MIPISLGYLLTQIGLTKRFRNPGSCLRYRYYSTHHEKEKYPLRSKVLSLLLLIVLLANAACAPQATPAALTTAPKTLPATQAPSPTTVPPTLVPTQTTSGSKSLTVLAAASLTESFTELGKMFETQNPGVKVSFSFAGSQQLAQQLDQGADADVFASASQKYMDAAVQSRRVNKEDVKIFVKNRLVVIFPKDNPAGLKELKDLAKPGLKLDLADKAVPVGQYALDFLDKASLGEVDAGIVYVTDVTVAAAQKIGKLDIPDALNTVATYPIAPISDSKNTDLAKAFVALVLSPDGQAVMAMYGFIPAAGGSK
jgi:molybdate transport system substrate-binding protein